MKEGEAKISKDSPEAQISREAAEKKAAESEASQQQQEVQEAEALEHRVLGRGDLESYSTTLEANLDSAVSDLEKKLGQPVSDESQAIIHTNMVSDPVEHASNEEKRLQELKGEQLPESKIEEAREILGAEHVLGPDRVKEVFGIELDQIPEIPFSKEELEQAKEQGARLILRINKFDENTPLTSENLLERMGDKKDEVFSSGSEYPTASDWTKGMSFTKEQFPESRWILTQTQELPETRFLSSEAQQAFMAGDREGLQTALDNMNEFWDNMDTDPEEIKRGVPPKEFRENAKRQLLDVDAYMALRERLPENASLPSVAEMIYDSAIAKEPLVENMSVATRTTVDAIPGPNGEPVRPFDFGYSEDGISLHTRRDTRFGRPIPLGQGSERIPGIPIAYLQIEK